MAWSLRYRPPALFAATALLLAAVPLLFACTCRDGDAGADDGAAPATEAIEPRTPAAPTPTATPSEGIPKADGLDPTEPRVEIAVKTADDLFAGRLEAVNARLEPGLREQLSAKSLGDIVAGVVAAHGEPARMMDAWAGELREEGRSWPTASVLLRMERSPVRFRLLLVFNHEGTVRGLWLRPI